LARAVTVSLLGYFFGRSWQALHHALGWGAWIIIGAVLLAVALCHLWRRRSKQP
jgi:membrane protein DedA with SNARE-associated domain